MNFILMKDLKTQNQMKHINVINYHIHRLMKDKKLAINSILSSNILTNSLTKILSTRFFKKHQKK